MRGIKRRWLTNSLTLSLVIVVIGVTGYSLTMASYYYNSTQKSIESRANATANYFSKYITSGYDEFHNSAVQFTKDFKDHSILELQFVNSSGRVLASAARQTVGYSPKTGDVAKALKDGVMSTFIGVDPLTDEQVLSVSAPLLYRGQEVIGVMRYVTSLREVNRRILIAMGTAILVGLALIFFTVITNLYFIRSIVGPIQEINHIAKNISGGSYGAKIETVYNDEIGELADTINEMSVDIARAEKQKSDFLSTVSHELRTPLTAISGWGEVLLTSDESDKEEIHKGVRIILKEANRLNKLVEELLDFSRMETGRMVMLMEPFDIAAELEEVVFMYLNNLSGEGVELHYEAPEEVLEVMGDRAHMRQVFLNVLDNAVKYGQSGKRIDVSLQDTPRDVIVSIRDYGQGISSDELPFIKRKFYRGNTKARGTGIGLSISDEIVRMHNGSLEVMSTLEIGTTVTINLPRTAVTA